MISAKNAAIEAETADISFDLKRKTEAAILNAVNKGERKVKIYCPFKDHYSLIRYLQRCGYSIEDDMEYFGITINW